MIKIDFWQLLVDYTWFGWWCGSHCEEDGLQFNSECKVCKANLQWYYTGRWRAQKHRIPSSIRWRIIRTDKWIQSNARF